MATSVAGVMMPCPWLRVEGINPSAKLLGSSRFLSRGVSLQGRVPSSVSVARDCLIVRNAVSTTEKRDGFSSKISDDDYAENFRPPHITDVFDIPARPSTFCAKTRSVGIASILTVHFCWQCIVGFV